MRFGRHRRARSTGGAGTYALLGALAAVAWVVVRRPQVRQAVIIPRDDVVDDVGARPAAEVADVAPGLEDEGPDVAVPAGWEPVDPLGPSPLTAGHDDVLSELQDEVARLQRENRVIMEGFLAVASDGDQPPEDVTLDQAIEVLRRHWRGPVGPVVGVNEVVPEPPAEEPPAPASGPSVQMTLDLATQADGEVAVWERPCACGHELFKHLMEGAATGCRACECADFYLAGDVAA